MRTLLVVVLVALAAAGCARAQGGDDDSGLDVNSIVDQLLDGARPLIGEQASLPDITEKFRKKVGPIKITGRFEARDGWVKSLSSLHRAGDATLAEDGDRLVVDVPLSLSDLQIGYDYKAKLGKLGPGGHLTATVESNAVHLRASLLINDDACSLAVESLELTDLGKIKVHATGLGKLNFLYSKIVTWVTAKLHDKISDAVQNGLKEAIAKAGLRLDCSSFFA